MWQVIFRRYIFPQSAFNNHHVGFRDLVNNPALGKIIADAPAVRIGDHVFAFTGERKPNLIFFHCGRGARGMMQRRTCGAVRTKRTTVHRQFTRRLALQTQRLAGGVSDIIICCLGWIRRRMIAPGLFLDINGDKLIPVTLVITVINIHVVNAFTHVRHRVWSDCMSSRIPSIFAHADAHHVMVFAVIGHRGDQHFKDPGRLKFPSLAPKLGNLRQKLKNVVKGDIV